MTPLASYELLALVVVILWLLWRFLNWTFDLLGRAMRPDEWEEEQS